MCVVNSNPTNFSFSRESRPLLLSHTWDSWQSQSVSASRLSPFSLMRYLFTKLTNYLQREYVNIAVLCNLLDYDVLICAMLLFSSYFAPF